MQNIIIKPYTSLKKSLKLAFQIKSLYIKYFLNLIIIIIYKD